MTGTDRSDVEEALHELSRKELVRKVRGSSMEGESEYSFWHVLVRDVAYAQIPRAARADRHLAAASWIEGVAGERVSDFAEILASHYTDALHLVRATGDEEQASAMEEPAIRYLVLAGDRAMALDVPRAETLYRQALELAPLGDAGRALVLGKVARTVQLARGDLAAATSLYEEAIAAHDARGEAFPAADLAQEFIIALAFHGERQRASSLSEQLITRLESEEPSPQLARMYALKAWLPAASSERIAWADRALDLADRLDLPDVRARALNFRGCARVIFGDPRGCDDLRDALALSLELGLVSDTWYAYSNFSFSIMNQSPTAALKLEQEALGFVRARGMAEAAHAIAAQRLGVLAQVGRWQELLLEADELIAWSELHGHRWTLVTAASFKSWILSSTGRVMEALRLSEALVEEAKEGQTGDTFSIVRIQGHRAGGRPREAARLLEEMIEVQEEVQERLGPLLGDTAREAVALERHDLLLRCGPLCEGDLAINRHGRETWRGLSTESEGRHEEALKAFIRAESGWAGFGNPYERAHALLGQGRCLIALGRSAEAETPLLEARELFGSLGATPALEETDAFLERSMAQTS
jgi:tetratricopeptide (TPR) repeat protein